MSENVTLAPLTSLTNDTSAIATINANSTLIEDAFADCLSLSGSQPNAMEANLDMNNFNIINLPSPSTINSPIRVTDLSTFSGGGTITLNPLPAGGSTNAVLHKNSGTDQDATWTLTPSGLTSIGATTSTVTTSNVTGTSVYTGSSSGTTTVQASATASGTLTLPAATDTLTGKATTDTLTNKTYDTAGTGNVFKINGTAISAVTGTGSAVLATSPTITTPGIVGVTNASNATAGNVGEVLSSVVAVGSAVANTTGAAVNVTSLALTAGDWEVQGSVNFLASAAAQTQSVYLASLSTTTGTVDLTGGRYVSASGGGNSYTANGLATLLTNGLQLGPVRFNVSTTTTVFLVAQSTFATSGTQSVYGQIHAVRMR